MGNIGSEVPVSSVSEIEDDPTTCIVYLVRHGRTVLNSNGLLRGHLDPPLDVVGLEEAEALGNEIAGFRPELVLTSPLARAMETAQAIAHHCGVTPRVEAELIDRDYGRYAGSSSEEVVAKWGSLDGAPGVESSRSVVSRARAVLDGVGGKEKRVVLVAHEAVNTGLLSSLDPDRWPNSKQIPQPTGCYNVIRYRKGRWEIAEVAIMPHV